MNILTISDLHGRTVWENVDFTAFDRVIFLGDYTDSYVVDDETIYANLSNVIKWKRQKPNKFILLIGNHDAQYIHFPHYRCSGFRSWAQPELSTLFAKYESLFQVAHQEGTYLFTHAGITNQWVTQLLNKMHPEIDALTPNFDLAGLLNEVGKQPLQSRNILFEVGPERGGRDACSGPIWADRSETLIDYLHGFHQVVGHTPIDDFTTIGDETGSITYTDVLQTKTAFYELTIPN